MENQVAVCTMIVGIGLLGAIGSIIGSAKGERSMVIISIGVAILNWILTVLICA